MTIKIITHWLTGQDTVPTDPVLVRDGIWAVKSWKHLQVEPKADSHWPFMLLALCVMASFLLPILAWGVEVPVLKNSLSRGDIISESDVTVRSMPEKSISPRVLRRAAELVGKEAHRPIRAGIPVYDSYVRTPPTIRKNGVVDVIYKAPGMTVLGTGKALQDGVSGHSIRFMNPNSGKIVHGALLADGRILVK